MPTCSFFPCQAKRAVQRGATAVIFDVSENPEAIDQVNSSGHAALQPPPQRGLQLAQRVTGPSPSSQGFALAR